MEDDNTDYEHIKREKVRTDKKGQSVCHQLSIWENLIEMRIHLQKCLLSANKFPQSDTYNKIKRESPESFTTKILSTTSTLTSLLEKLLHLQELLLKRNQRTRKTDSDEEIPSDTEDEQVNAEPVEKKQRIDFLSEIAKRHSSYSTYRNSVIQKWNEKTNMAVAAKKVATHSVLDHITHILSDRQKLVRRSQIIRGDYVIVGENAKETSENIFDDNDFYYQLLHELIELKSVDVTDSVQLGRQWIQLQSLRSKMKRKVDTKTTKGRKIRYVVHNKLVNFMAPIEENAWADETKDELFSSLFGKTL